MKKITKKNFVNYFWITIMIISIFFTFPIIIGSLLISLEEQGNWGLILLALGVLGVYATIRQYKEQS